MAKKRPKKKPVTSSKPKAGFDLRRLSQTDAGLLIGKRASWVRERCDIDCRNKDGTYNAISLVKAIRHDYRAASLSESDQQAITDLATAILDLSSTEFSDVVLLLKRVKATHGAAGLAKVGETLLATAEEWLRDFGSSPEPAKCFHCEAEL